MRVLFDIGHPGHIHLFKNTYFSLKSKGHDVFVTIRDSKIHKDLLNSYEIPYTIVGSKKDTIFKKGIEQIKQNALLLKFVKKNKIDIGVSSGIALPQLSKITKLKSITLDDDDDDVEPLFVKFGHRFTDTLLSPNVITRKSSKNIKYNGTHELAYLHPTVFSPNKEIFNELGVEVDEVYFILRFVAFKGHHDVGQTGISLEKKRLLINLLDKYGKIFITSEDPIDEEFEKYRIKISPEKIHSALYYATMFLGDSQTMTSEAAVLGTPALKCNTFAGKLSVPNDLENKYKLCLSYHPDQFDEFLAHTERLIKSGELKLNWKQRLEDMLKDKINVSGFLTWFVENYPESKGIMTKDPNYQDRFK